MVPDPTVTTHSAPAAAALAAATVGSSACTAPLAGPMITQRNPQRLPMTVPIVSRSPSPRTDIGVAAARTTAGPDVPPQAAARTSPS